MFPPDPPSTDPGQAFEDYWSHASTHPEDFVALGNVLRALDQNISDPTALANAKQAVKESHQRAWHEHGWWLDHSGGTASATIPPPIVRAKKSTTAGTREAEPEPENG